MKIGCKVRLSKSGYYLVKEGSIGILQKIETKDGKELAYVKWTNKINTANSSETDDEVLIVETRHLMILEVELPKVENERCTCCNRVKKHLVVIDEKIICEKCYKELYTICGDCGTLVINENSIKKNDISICRECLNENYKTCSDCGEYIRKSEVKANKHNANFCKSCYNKKYFICNKCLKEETIDKKIKMNSDNVICTECFNLYYFKCDDCGEVRTNERIFVYKNGRYCNDCAPKYYAIKQYSWRPLQIKPQKERWDNLLYMGIELEVENVGGTNSAEQYASKFREEFLEKNKVDSLIYMKHDGSIRGYEIVTHPFTMNAINKLKIREMCKYLKETKHQSFESGRCGLHIHMNKDFFKVSDIKKMCAFFSANKTQLRELSNRGTSGDENYYRYIDYNMDMYFKNQYTNERHVALNTHTGKETVEIRIFRGSLRMEDVIGAIQFADSLAHFIVIGEASIMHLLQNKSWDTYVEWLQGRTEYDILKNLIKERVKTPAEKSINKRLYTYSKPS